MTRDHQAIDPEESELDAALQEATRLGEEERWDEAYQLLTDLEPDYPEAPTLLCMLGVVAGEMEARGLAYDYFRRSLAAQPQDPHVLVALGMGLARFDDPDAEGVLRLAAITAPHLALARLHYGAYLAREGIFDLALTELRAALEIDPDDARIERELGATHLLAGAVEEGVARLERAASLAPEDAEMRLLYALSLLRARQMELGAEELIRAAADLVEEGEVQVAAALAAATQEWMDEAWNALARAEVSPHPADSVLLRELEDALEAGPEAADHLLSEHLLERLLHERLMERA